MSGIAGIRTWGCVTLEPVVTHFSVLSLPTFWGISTPLEGAFIVSVGVWFSSCRKCLSSTSSSHCTRMLALPARGLMPPRQTAAWWVRCQPPPCGYVVTRSPAARACLALLAARAQQPGASWRWRRWRRRGAGAHPGLQEANIWFVAGWPSRKPRYGLQSKVSWQ